MYSSNNVMCHIEHDDTAVYMETHVTQSAGKTIYKG